MNFENNFIITPELNPWSGRTTRKLCFFIHPTIYLQFMFILPRNADSYRLACIEGIILTAGQIFVERMSQMADRFPCKRRRKRFFPFLSSFRRCTFVAGSWDRPWRNMRLCTSEQRSSWLACAAVRQSLALPLSTYIIGTHSLYAQAFHWMAFVTRTHAHTLPPFNVFGEETAKKDRLAVRPHRPLMPFTICNANASFGVFGEL